MNNDIHVKLLDVIIHPFPNFNGGLTKPHLKDLGEPSYPHDTVDLLSYPCPNLSESVFVKSAFTWWRHQMESFSALLAICAGNSPATGEFPAQRPVTQSFDVFFDLHLNKRLSEQRWGWWFETPSRPLWRHYNRNVD